MKREREDTAAIIARMVHAWSDPEAEVSAHIATEQLRFGHRIAAELVKRTMIRGPFIQELLMELLDED